MQINIPISFYDIPQFQKNNMRSLAGVQQFDVLGF